MKLTNKGFGTLGYVLIGCGVIVLIGILIIGIGGYSLFKLGDTALKETYAYAQEEDKVAQELRDLPKNLQSKEDFVKSFTIQKNLRKKFENIKVSETIKPTISDCRKVRLEMYTAMETTADQLLVMSENPTPDFDKMTQTLAEGQKKIEDIKKNGEKVCSEYTAKVKEATDYNEKLKEMNK